MHYDYNHIKKIRYKENQIYVVRKYAQWKTYERNMQNAKNAGSSCVKVANYIDYSKLYFLHLLYISQF